MVPHFIPQFYIDLALPSIRQFPDINQKEIRTRIARNSVECHKLLNIMGYEKSGYDMVPFVWAKIKNRRQANAVVALLYRRYRLLVLPGTAFGGGGEGFLRFSLTVPTQSYSTAVERVQKRNKRVKLGSRK